MFRRFSIPVNYRYILTVILLLLSINFVLRLTFLLYNYAQFEAITWSDMLLGFVIGVRYDLAVIFIFNGIVLLFLSLPLKANLNLRTYKVSNWLILLLNLPIVVMNGIDIIYFSYSEKRLTHELFTTKSDFGSFKPEMLVEWWWVFAITGASIFISFRLLDHYSRKFTSASSESLILKSGKAWGVTLSFFLLAICGIRGVNRQPLSTANAFVVESTFIGNLGLNSAFTVLSALDYGEDRPLNWIPEDEAIEVTRSLVKNDFDGDFSSSEYPLLRKSSFVEEEKRYNVVFLIIESLNASNTGCISGKQNSLTPNLDSLVRHGRMFSNHYANGVRSIQALPALFNSMPEIFRRPTIGSRYMENNHYGLGQMLEERGYFNAFFCGSHNGTMGFDLYAQKSGIENYYGMDEYPHSERDFDGFWGCPDGLVLPWMAETQNSFEEPFFSTFFSISNHHPFNLPKDANPEIARLPISKMKKTTAYTDQALGEYFRKVSQYDWYKRTVFVLTGDHCFHEQSDPERQILDNFHVPMLIIAPGLEPGMDDQISSHISVLPTLIDILKLETYHTSVGRSLFDSQPTFLVNNLLDLTTLASDSIAFTSNFLKTQASLKRLRGDWVRRPVESAESLRLSKQMDYRLRCLYQVLHNMRAENRFMVAPQLILSMANEP